MLLLAPARLAASATTATQARLRMLLDQPPYRGVQQWMQRHVNDPYVKASRKQELRSRAAFKLKEMHEKHRILRRGDCVLDLGCAPGGWSEVALQLVRPPETKPPPKPAAAAAPGDSARGHAARPPTSPTGRVIGIDLRPILPLPGLTFLQGDFTEAATQAALRQALEEEGKGGSKVDIILSDMAPDLSGEKFADHRRTLDMCYEVLAFADQVFTQSTTTTSTTEKKKPRNRHTVLCKFFKGRDEVEFVAYAQARYAEVRLLKPKASRSESGEMYLLARGFVGGGGAEREDGEQNQGKTEGETLPLP